MHSHREIPSKRIEAAERVKRASANRIRTLQVMPPHHVDLPLAPTPVDDIHVPAHVSGADLSKGGLQTNPRKIDS
ncbi:hypothetical protein [Oryzifoliimicrobium ureilyticus]|uniref:hypothetical protein n=1 Tax=Oryzifoliimicrobium ureilyticus TaxID=3113724 RepID=UPI0030761434